MKNANKNHRVAPRSQHVLKRINYRSWWKSMASNWSKHPTNTKKKENNFGASQIAFKLSRARFQKNFYFHLFIFSMLIEAGSEKAFRKENETRSIFCWCKEPRELLSNSITYIDNSVSRHFPFLSHRNCAASSNSLKAFCNFAFPLSPEQCRRSREYQRPNHDSTKQKERNGRKARIFYFLPGALWLTSWGAGNKKWIPVISSLCEERRSE